MKQHFQQLRQFYRGNFSHWFFITSVSFVVLILLCFFLGLADPDLPEFVMNWFSESVDELGVVDEMGNFSAIALFFNNLRAMVVGMSLGFLPFIYISALPMGVNSMLLGVFAAFYVNHHTPLSLYFAALFPHALFELPAMIISFTCGLYLCHIVTDFVRSNQKGLIKYAVIDVLRVLLLNIVPLLIVAAVLETYATPAFLELFR